MSLPEAVSAPDFNIVRTSHVELAVTDLEKSRKFYVETLGLHETDSDSSHVYLRGMEDRYHHCLILTMAERPYVKHIAFRVESDRDLDKIARMLEALRLDFVWVEAGAEKGLGRALRFQDPLGFPVEFFCEMEASEWLLQKFHLYRNSRILRIDHVNLLTPDVTDGTNWYMTNLGFRCSEYTEAEKGLWATWLRRKPTVHDVALMTGAGPRLHHIGFSVAEKSNILDAADVLASKDYLKNIERGPGRHGISNAFFLYVRDPDGHRVELYTGDYLSVDPNWKPLKWRLDDPKRQTFWGAPAPERWFNEASQVQSVKLAGELVETRSTMVKTRAKNARR